MDLSHGRSRQGGPLGKGEVGFRGTISHHENRAIPADVGSIGGAEPQVASGDVCQVFNGRPNESGPEGKRDGHSQRDDRLQNQS